MTRFGRYFLPSRAVSALRANGVTTRTIEQYSIAEMSRFTGFGAAAADGVRKVRERDRLPTSVQKAMQNKTIRQKVQKEIDPFDFGPILLKATEEEIPSEYNEEQEVIDADVPAEAMLGPRLAKMMDGRYDLRDPLDAKKALALRFPTKQSDPDRLVVNLGEEHGLKRRHIDWLKNVVANAPAELGVPNLDRLVTKLIVYSYSLDPTKGGVLGVKKGDGEVDVTPRVGA